VANVRRGMDAHGALGAVMGWRGAPQVPRHHTGARRRHLDRREFLRLLGVGGGVGLLGCQPALRRRRSPAGVPGPLSAGIRLSPARLPVPAWDQAAAWDGRVAYLFGGWTGARYLEEILVFDPGSPTLTATGEHLPFARNGVRAAWIDGVAYTSLGAASGFHRFPALRTRSFAMTLRTGASGSCVPLCRRPGSSSPSRAMATGPTFWEERVSAASCLTSSPTIRYPTG